MGGKSLGIGAAVIPIDSDGTYATSFRIILGFNPTLTAGEQISVAHASVVDTKGRQANNDIKFTLPDVVLPTIASMNAIATNDLDGSGDFNAGDTIVVSFSELVDIYSLTMDVVNTFSLSNGHSFGTDFTVAAIGEVDGFSSQFVITLGDAPSIAEADSLIIDVDKVKDKAGNKPAADLTLSIPSIIVPAADDTNPIAVSEAGGSTIGVYDAGDTITFKFNKPVATSLALSDLTVGSKSFGAGATLTAGSESPAGYAAEFTLTLGSNTDVTQGDEVSVLAVKVIDQSDTLALDNVVFTLPDITPPQAIGNAIPGDSGALVGSYDVGDTLTVNFSEAIQLSEMTDGDLGTTINLNNGHSFGVGATIAASNAETVIVSGVDSDVDGVYSRVVDVDALALLADFDPSIDNINNLIDKSKPVYSFTNSAGEIWYLWARQTSGYHISQLDNTDKWFWESFNMLGGDASYPWHAANWKQASGDASPLVGFTSTDVTTAEVEGYATQFEITLGVGTDIAGSDVISINADQIRDEEANTPSGVQKFNVPAVSTPVILDISIADGVYKAGDVLELTVKFSEDITITPRGKIVSITLDIGGSEVKADYSGQPNSDELKFVHEISSGVDIDGITIKANSLDLPGAATIKNRANENIDETHGEQYFPNVKVDASFSLAAATTIWLDGQDVDGDGDTSDQNPGDKVGRWVDKSGSSHDVVQTNAARIPTVGLNKNGQQSVYFDGNDKLTSNYVVQKSYSVFYTAELEGTQNQRVISSVSTNFLLGYHYGDEATLYTNEWKTVQHPRRATTNTNLFGLVDDGSSSSSALTFFDNGIVNEYSAGDHSMQKLAIGGGYAGRRNLFRQLSKVFVNEVLVFDKALNLAEAVLVQNYLSSKWATSLDSAIDYYSGDITANGDYDYDVTGIIKLTSSSVTSGSHGALVISNGSADGFLKNTGDAIFLGSKGQGVVNTDLATAATANIRSGKVWYFDATDAATAGGTVNLSFDLEKLGLNILDDVTDYVLLWRSAASGQFYEIAVADAINGNDVVFNSLYVDSLVTDAVVQSSKDVIKDGYITVVLRDADAPEYQASEVAVNSITLSFNEDLNAASVPSVSDFVVDVGGARTVTEVAIAGNTVTLTFDGPPVTDDDSVSYSYIKPAFGAVLEDIGGNDAVMTNVVVGTSGVNTLIGSHANDTLVGNAGDDELDGLTGADTFDYNSVTDGHDLIKNFTLGLGADGDKLDFSDLLNYTETDVLSHFLTVTDTGVGGDVTIAVDANGDGSGPDITITLLGIGDGTVMLDDLADNLKVL